MSRAITDDGGGGGTGVQIFHLSKTCGHRLLPKVDRSGEERGPTCKAAYTKLQC